MQEQAPRVVLITGANKGIGFEVAQQLGAKGLHIIIGSRTLASGTEAARILCESGVTARAVHLDLLDQQSIEKAADDIAGMEGRLDVLINNAGVVDVSDGAPSTASIDALRRVIDTNFFGTTAVTQAMLPLLRNAPAARIINQSSGLGSLTLNCDPEWEFFRFNLLGYSASKAALNVLTVQLAKELAEEGISVHSADPGFTATDLNGHTGSQTVEEGALIAVRLASQLQPEKTASFQDCNSELPW